MKIKERIKAFFSNKEKVKSEVSDVLLVLAGSLVLALADALFIVPCQIINGGVDSLGILVNFYLQPLWGFDVTDIAIAIAQVALWLLGLWLLGIKFSIHTLLGSLAFPLFYSLLLRFGVMDACGLGAVYQKYTAADGSLALSVLVVAGLFGGALSGAGVALAYLGSGSTGGFDIVSFIIAKYSEMKQDISGFILDTALVLLGLLCMQNWELALSGVLSTFACALAVQYIYILSNSFYIAEIISEKTEAIEAYIHEDLGHASTIIDTQGGYTGEKRKMIRVVIYRVEISSLKDYVASIDPKAFLSITQAKTINGQGFEAFVISNKSKNRNIARYKQLKKKAERKRSNPKPQIETNSNPNESSSQ